jgi:hypothetical protein
MAQLKQITAPPSFSTEEELEALLQEGMASGEPIDVTPEFWANLHAQLSERRSASRKAS